MSANRLLYSQDTSTNAKLTFLLRVLRRHLVFLLDSLHIRIHLAVVFFVKLKGGEIKRFNGWNKHKPSASPLPARFWTNSTARCSWDTDRNRRQNLREWCLRERARDWIRNFCWFAKSWVRRKRSAKHEYGIVDRTVPLFWSASRRASWSIRWWRVHWAMQVLSRWNRRMCKPERWKIQSLWSRVLMDSSKVRSAWGDCLRSSFCFSSTRLHLWNWLLAKRLTYVGLFASPITCWLNEWIKNELIDRS